MYPLHGQDVRHDAKPRKPLAAPRLSVVLGTFNRRTMLLSTLASLRRQTLSYDQFEVIVVDNGSTDGTPGAVQHYIQAGTRLRDAAENWQVQCLSTAENSLAHAYNVGLQAAQGEFVVFMEDDVVVDPLALTSLLALCDEEKVDAIAARVELRWEAARPYWLSDELLDVLGHFAPSETRCRLDETCIPSRCCFAVSRAALQAIGPIPPLLGKRQHMPLLLEVVYLTRCLRRAGYTFWYEPRVIVRHRVTTARLQRAFFTGRAYWQGRSEVLLDYAETHLGAEAVPYTLRDGLSQLVEELKEWCVIAAWQRPLLWLAGTSSNEQLVAAMEQARYRGRLYQQLRLLEHRPAELTTPAVLLVQPTSEGPTASAPMLLARALRRRGIPCLCSKTSIPLSWLWQQRAYEGRATGILHLYQPGACALTPGQRWRSAFLLRLARRWGIAIVCSDTGGWWQSARMLRSQPYRRFERMVFMGSTLVLNATHRPDQLYHDRRLRQRVRCLPQPGFRGYVPPLPTRARAFQQLGLPVSTPYVYLCCCEQHTERELLFLLDAFEALLKASYASIVDAYRPQLLFVGMPYDRDERLHPKKLFRRAAQQNTLHCFWEASWMCDWMLFLGAADALVLPYAPHPKAGTLELPLLALSYNLKVVAADVPRLHHTLPADACLLYNPEHRSALAAALRAIQPRQGRLTEREARLLDAEDGWDDYAQQLEQCYLYALKNL